MRMLVDMDGVLVDMNTKMRLEMMEWGIRLKPVSECTQWGIETWAEGDPEYQKKIVKKLVSRIFEQEGFFQGLQALDINSGWVLGKWMKRAEVFIATTPWWSSKTSAYDKVRWVQKNLPTIDVHKQMILTGQKHIIDADVIIDDKPSNILSFVEEPTGYPIQRKALVYDHPYNRVPELDRDDVFRVKDWLDIDTVLESFL